MPFRVFCAVFVLILCGNAVTVYFASHSIRLTVVTMLACSLLLQLAYFASVLFLVWRASCASRAGQRAEHFDRYKEGRYQPPDYDEVRDESSDVPQLVRRPEYRCSVEQR